MHSSSSALLAGALCLALLGVFAPYDSPNKSAVSPSTPAVRVTSPSVLTLRKDVREVAITFVATDEDGRPVMDMRSQQVHVYSDAAPVPSINSFYEEGDLPLRLFVLVDTSDSVTSDFLAELKATDQFAARLLRPRIDHISWSGFAAHMQTYPETSQPSLRPANLGRSGIGQTALYDAVYETVTRETGGPDERLSRKVLFVLSDGEDNWSRRSLNDAIDAARAAGFTIYCVTAHNPRSEPEGDMSLRKLAIATGGRAYILSSYDHIGGVLDQVEKELRSQYLLTFSPPSATCGLHSVMVVPFDHAVEIRSKNAYYVGGC